METVGHGQRDFRLIQLAQYLARLTAHQKVWTEIGKALVNFLEADWVAFGERDADGKIRLRDETGSARVPRQAWLELPLAEAVTEVLESGFLTWRILHRPEPLSVAFLPIAREHQIIAVMLVGYRISESSLKALLDTCLAVAELVGTTVARLAAEQELRQHRQNLEQLIQQRTAALSVANDRLQQEIVQRLQAEAALRAEKDNLIRILETMEDVIYIASPDHDIEYVNPAFAKEFPDDRNRKCYQLIFGREQVCPWCRTPAVLLGQTSRSEQYCARNGKTYDVIEAPLKNADGSLSVLAIFRDISERKRSEDLIREMAYHDALTGLPNRLLFNDRLCMALNHARRHGHKVALMMLDLDRFKPVNDALGHDVGDRLLEAVAARLTGLVRDHDTVARLGGDEFAVILPEITRAEDAIRVAEKIVASFQQPFVLRLHELSMTTSVGIALYPDDGDEGEALMKQADLAMYHAKQKGRNSYQAHVA